MKLYSYTIKLVMCNQNQNVYFNSASVFIKALFNVLNKDRKGDEFILGTIS